MKNVAMIDPHHIDWSGLGGNPSQGRTGRGARGAHQNYTNFLITTCTLWPVGGGEGLGMN